MKRYRKKPIAVEAIEWDDTVGTFDQIDKMCSNGMYSMENGALVIEALEGSYEASKGDMIIRGVKGECYPCKPDIFAETYEVIKDD